MASPASDGPAETRTAARRGPRTRWAKFRVTDEEHAGLAAKAKAADIPMSVLLRDHFGRVRIRHRQDERKRLALLNRINANINMIARWVNTHKGRADATIIQAHLVAIEREITRLLAALERR
jgi:hypothetical protein